MRPSNQLVRGERVNRRGIPFRKEVDVEPGVRCGNGYARTGRGQNRIDRVRNSSNSSLRRQEVPQRTVEVEDTSSEARVGNIICGTAERGRERGEG